MQQFSIVGAVHMFITEMRFSDLMEHCVPLPLHTHVFEQIEGEQCQNNTCQFDQKYKKMSKTNAS